MSFEDTLRAIVREELERLLSKPAASEFVDQDTCGPVARTAYMRAARAGVFPSSRVGKRIIAKRSDFETWLSANPTAVVKPAPVPATVAKTPSTREERLAASGFRIARAK